MKQKKPDYTQIDKKVELFMEKLKIALADFVYQDYEDSAQYYQGYCENIDEIIAESIYYYLAE